MPFAPYRTSFVPANAQNAPSDAQKVQSLGGGGADERIVKFTLTVMGDPDSGSP